MLKNFFTLIDSPVRLLTGAIRKKARSLFVRFSFPSPYKLLILLLTLLQLSPFLYTPLYAFPVLPTGGSFAAGGGSISSSGSSMTVNQNTSKAIINWNSFSIGKDGQVFFNNGQGATLNRVTGSSISSIAGLLKATGSLYLINPNGIVITPSGSVITGGDFIASTLNEPNSDFLNNIISLTGTTGSVVNEGSINASGSAILVGTMVTNTGTVNSSSDAALVSSTRLVLMPGGLSGIIISPSAVSGSVTNQGVIKAASVDLTSADGNVYALAGNNDGLIEATGSSTINGQVWLTAPKGTVTVSSPVKSSSDIYIDGTQGTNLTSSSSLYSNGGDIKIGLFPLLPESLVTSLSSNSSIYNPLGSVETSGDTLNMGDITVKAQNWLLDPTDFTIDTSNNSTIDIALNGGDNVTITTSASGATGTNTTTSASISNGTTNTGTSGDINVDAPLSWSSANTLTLSAYNSINVNSTITASGGGGLALTYNTGNLTQNYSTDTGILDFPLTSSGFTGSVQFTGTSSTGTSSGNPTGSLTIDGTSYTLVNANNLSTVGSTGYYALATDITLPALATGSNTNFTPIGESTPFTGTFNGLGNTISDLIIGTSSSGYSGTYAGLFGQVGSVGTVENVGLLNESIYDRFSNTYTGGLVGANIGTVSDSYSTGTVSGKTSVGGLVGANIGTVSYSYSTGSVTDTGSSGSVGGLVGTNSVGGEIVDSYFTGKVINTDNGAAGSDYVGGLVGYNYGSTITDSYNTGSVTNTTDSVSGGYDYVGGFVGDNDGEISTSYSSGSVTNEDNSTGGHDYVGGFAGASYNFQVSNVGISDSYSTGNVTNTNNSTNPNSSDFSNDRVGGFVGDNAGTSTSNGIISDSYSTGNVTDDNYSTIPDAVGGFAGENEFYGTISYSYSTGTVSAINVATGYNSLGGIGGLVGVNTNTGILPTGGSKLTEGTPAISDSYSTGTVSCTGSSGSIDVGGLVGANAGGVVDSYWDTTTNPTVTLEIGNNTGSTGVNGLTTSKLVSALPTDFSNTIWGDATGQTTPYLLSDSSFGTVSGYVIPYTEDSSTSPTLYGVILTPTQLQNINTTGLSNDCVLGTDINLSGVFFTPIGESSSFTGTFDGLGNTISNLTIGTSSSQYSGKYAGLFGQVGSGGTVENVGLLKESIYGNNSSGYTGGLVGANSGGTVTDSYSTGTVSGYNYVGGLVGYNNDGAVSDSYSTGNVSGTYYVGGLVGYNGGTATVTDSYSTGNVSGTNSVGGLVGWNSGGTVSDSYSTGSVSGTSSIGGLVGANSGGTVTDSYSTGSVTGTGSANYTGGLVGGNTSGGTVSDSYSTGTVTGYNFVGGLVGGNTSGGTVSDSYSTGSVTGTDNVGGLVGDNGGGTYTSDYWDTYGETTGAQSQAAGTSSTITGVTGLTDSQMKQLSSFSAWGSSIINKGSSYVNSAATPWFIYNGETYPLLTAFMTPITVTANNASSTYNGSPYTAAPTGVTYNGSSAEPSNILGTLGYGSPTNVGTYGLTGLYSDQQGYIISYGMGELTINPAPSVTVYSDIFQAFIGSVPNGLNNANDIDNILIPILTSYEGSGSLPNIPPSWKGGKIINELYSNGFNSKYNYNFNYYRHKHHKSRKHYVK